MSFRFLNQAPVYLDNSGVPCALGSLTFTNTATTTPKTVYSDKALGTPITNPVVLDAAGRAPVDIWGSGSYRVVLKDADGVVIKTLDNVDEISTGASLPTAVAGQFVTSVDGIAFSMAEIFQLPDQTGNAQKYLQTDGTDASWVKVSNVPLVSTVTSSGTVTPDAGYDLTVVTAQAAPLVIANPSGTWSQGQAAVVWVKDNGTARAVSFGANILPWGVSLPTTTVVSKWLSVGFWYNSISTKWYVVSVNQEA